MADKVYIAEFDAKGNAYFNRLNEMEARTKASANRISQAFGNVQNAVTKIGGAMAAIGAISFLKASIDEAIESQKYLEKLERAYGKLSNSMKEYINTLELTTRYSDADITSAMSRIGTYVKEENLLKQLTEATMDFATAKEMDLTQAAELVTKSIISNTNALSRYGIEINTSASAIDKANQILEQFSIFQGQSKLDIESNVDRLQMLNKEFDNLKENIGNELLPVFVTALETIHQTIYAIKVGLEWLAGDRSWEEFMNTPINELMKLDKRRKELGAKLLDETKKSFANFKMQFDVGINPDSITQADKLFRERVKIVGKDLSEDAKKEQKKKSSKLTIEEEEQYVRYITKYARYKDVDKTAVEQLSKEIMPTLSFDPKVFAEQMQESMVKVNDVGEGLMVQWANEAAEQFRDKFSEVQNIARNVQSLFNLAADSFVGKLISGVETVAQILEIISSVKSLFGVTTIMQGFAGGGSIVNTGSNVTVTPLPRFASGGSFIVPPGYSYDNYPILVKSGERVDITPVSNTMNITSLLKQINKSIQASTMTAIKYNSVNKPVVINLELDGRTLTTSVISNDNKLLKAGLNRNEL